jgi:predicted protein tyrosine phosphatase
MLEEQNKLDEANKNGTKFINEVASDSAKVERMASYFIENEKIEWAEKYIRKQETGVEKKMHTRYS